MQDSQLGFKQAIAKHNVELLSPAGNLTKLKIALNYGADAVYGGVSHFSLRNRASKDFTYEDFQKGIEYAHARNKKVYVTINGFPFNSQIESLKNHIAKMRDMQPDAFIIAAPGVVRLAKEIAPNIPIHLSTQANVLNVLDAQVYYDMGVKRIVVAREISLNDCEAIKKALPNLELEMFVHGSMCFAFSGRCLISSLQHGRVPNRGSCANDCRFDYEYFVRDSTSGNLINFAPNELYVKNPDNNVVMKIKEGEFGTHIFNAKDLNLASHLHDILESGAISALKIEGRTKSTYYAGITARTYRLALQDYTHGISRTSLYQYELHTLKNRGFTDGYIVHRPFARLDTQNHDTAISEGSYQVCAEVDESGLYCLCKHTIRKGDLLEIIAPLQYYQNTQFGLESNAILSREESILQNETSHESSRNMCSMEAQKDSIKTTDPITRDFIKEDSIMDLRQKTFMPKDSSQKHFKQESFMPESSKQKAYSHTHFLKESCKQETSIKPDSMKKDSTHNLAQKDSQKDSIEKDFTQATMQDNKESMQADSIQKDSIQQDSIKEALLYEQSNASGMITCIQGRYYLRFYKIILQNGKEVAAIHSGNTNPIALPFKLPPFSFLRVRIAQ